MDVLRSGLWLLFCSLISGCSSLSYVMDQGLGQLRLMNRARPISEVMQSPFTKPQTKWAIERVLEAKKYAVDSLGLKATANYQSYVSLNDPYVVYVAAAAHPLKLESKKWHFPIVGEVPYLGFFDKDKAIAFAEKLRMEADPPWDIWVRGASAFSSLGWFPDPLYSSMIEKASERDIADVVIHESVHATVWVGSNVDFNESLANFVGLHGGLEFIGAKYAGEKEKIAEAESEVVKERLFATFIENSMERYRREVQSPEQKKVFYTSLEDAWKKFLKAQKNAPTFKDHSPDFADWNNAALLSFGNYYSDYGVFESVLKACDGNLRRFVNWIRLEKKEGAFSEAPLEFLQGLGKGGICPP